MQYIVKRLLIIFLPMVGLWKFEFIKGAVVQNPVLVMLFLSFFAVIIGIIIQKQTFREKNTLDFEGSYKHDKDIAAAFKITKTACLTKKRSEIEDLSNKMDSNDALAITSILNEWERAANAINHKLYDEDMLYNVYGSTVVFLLIKLQPFVMARQRVNPRFFANFTTLAIKWQLRRAKENDKTKDEYVKHALRDLHTDSINLQVEISRNNGIACNLSSLARSQRQYERVR